MIYLCESAIDFMFEKYLYADGKTKLSDSRKKSLLLSFTVFKQVDLICHVRRNNSKAKTEAKETLYLD